MKRKKRTVPEYIYAETYEGPAEDRYSTVYKTTAPTIRRVQVHVSKSEPFIYPYVFDLAVVPHEPDAATFDESVFKSEREKERREPRANIKRVSNRWKPYGPHRVYYPAEYLTARQLRNMFAKLEQEREREAWEHWEHLAWNDEFLRNPLGGNAINEAVKAKRRAIELLGVDRDATHSVIKKQYRTLAVLHHPDHGGDAFEFKRIQEAAERLLQTESYSG